MSILDCNFPAINKGMELFKEIDKLIQSKPEYAKIVGDIRLFINDDDEGLHRIGYWHYFDDEAIQFTEDSSC